MTIWRWKENRKLLIFDFGWIVLVIDEETVAWERDRTTSTWMHLLKGGSIARSELWEQVYP